MNIEVKVYQGEKYLIHKRRQVYNDEYRDDYIRITWDTGYIDMRKSHWDKLKKKQKDLIFGLAD